MAFFRFLATCSAIVLLSVSSTAATDQPVSPLEGMFFQSAKLPVVVAVVAIILIGVCIYLLRIDRRLKELEQALND